MTVIPDLEKQLVRAAARAPATPGRSRRRWRMRVAGAAAAALIVLSVGVISLGGGSGQASAAARVLEQTARSAANGLAAPRLHPGQAWFTSELGLIASSWEPVTPGPLPPSTTVLPSSRAVAEERFRFENWIFYNGDGRTRGGHVGRARFFGSASERARWIANGAQPRMTVATGGGVTISNGFTVGTKNLTYQQVLDFPTDPTGVLRFLTGAQPAGSNVLDGATNLLVQVPLLPAARAAVFRALAKLPGVRYLGPVRDPLGRPGVAVAIYQSAVGYVLGINGRTPTPVTHLRSELIFNPQTAGLLAQETLLLNPPHIPGVRAPFAISWTAYVTSRVVAQSSAPTLKQLGYRPPPPLHLPPTTSPPVLGVPVAPNATVSPPPTTTQTP
jgi:hypothetical protein